MAVGVVEILATNDRQPCVGYAPQSKGTLQGLTVVVGGVAPPFGVLLVEAGIMRGGRGDVYKCAVLVHDYVYIGHPAFWTGFIKMAPGDDIYLEVRSSEALVVRLNDYIALEEE